MSSLLDHYWPLASDNATERIDAAEALIKGLIASDTIEDWDYALKRLITGLSSSRGSARLGFSMALAEILTVRQQHITIQDYLAKAAKAFAISGSMKGAEERGLLFGKLFALQTLAKSPLWSFAGAADFEAFVTAAVQLARQKVWLREPAIYALSELAARLQDLSLPRDRCLRFLFQCIHTNGLSKTCDGVALALLVSPAERVEFNAESGWKNGDPLAKGNLQDLAKVLKEVPAGVDDKKGGWKSSIHFVWRQLLAAFTEKQGDLEPPSKKRKKEKSKSKRETVFEGDNEIGLAEFWRGAVDESFFASNASPERKMCGFGIFALWLPSVPDVVPLFSTNLIRTLSNQLSQSDRYLHKMAKKVVAIIVETAQQRGNAAVIIQCILKQNPNFDRTSKSKTIQDLIPLVSSDIATLTTSLLDIFGTEDGLQKKQWALDLIIQLVRAKKSEVQIEWVCPILERLCAIAYFAAPNVPDDVVKLTQERIMSILSASMGMSADASVSLPYQVIKTILARQAQGSSPRIQFEGEVLKAKQRAEGTLEKIHKKRVSSRHVDSPELQAFELLFSMVLLQIYSEDAEAINILGELQLVYTKIARSARQQDAYDEDIDTSQVLTEILISFLAQQSALLRKLSEDVWASFSGRITLQSLQLLFDILNTPEDVEGQQQLFEVDDGDMELVEEDDDDAENGNMPESESASESSSASDASEDESTEETVVDAEAERALARTLGVKQDESESEDDDEDEEDSMDDEQMAALDDQLASIFRERKEQLSNSKQQKREKQQAKLNIVLLKSRVVDLLDIFVTKQPSSLLGLAMLPPLLATMQKTRDHVLAEKARDLIRDKICRKTHYTLGTEEQVKGALSLMEKVQETAAVAVSKLTTLACNQVSVFLTKLLVASDPELLEPVSAIYTATLLNWFADKKNRVAPNLFVDWVNFLASKRSS